MDDSSVLIFSGGQTRRDVGPTSEAASYYYLAEEKKWIKSLESRVFLEEYARDSFENLLFSVCRFKEVTGYYPSRISVVGFDFKGNRFQELHRKAIGFPSANFTYVGVRTVHPHFDQSKAVQGESVARETRNPFRRTVPYELACPEMSELLHWCGPTLFTGIGDLPWGRRATADKVATSTKSVGNGVARNSPPGAEKGGGAKSSSDAVLRGSAKLGAKLTGAAVMTEVVAN
eukprot:gene25384-31842_t